MRQHTRLVRLQRLDAGAQLEHSLLQLAFVRLRLRPGGLPLDLLGPLHLQPGLGLRQLLLRAVHGCVELVLVMQFQLVDLEVEPALGCVQFLHMGSGRLLQRRLLVEQVLRSLRLQFGRHDEVVLVRRQVGLRDGSHALVGAHCNKEGRKRTGT